MIDDCNHYSNNDQISPDMKDDCYDCSDNDQISPDMKDDCYDCSDNDQISPETKKMTSTTAVTVQTMTKSVQR